MAALFETLHQFPLYKQEGWSETADALPFLEYSLLFGLAVFLFEYYLDYRQLSKFRGAKKIPSELEGHEQVTEDKFKRANAYGIDKYSFGLFQGLFMFAEGQALLLLGFMPYAWDYATSLALRMGLFTAAADSFNTAAADVSSPLRREIAITLVFIGLMVLHDTVVGLPFSLYSTFVVEQRHGFNKTTLGLFVKDKVMGLLLSAVIGGPILAVMIWVVRATGANFFFYVWLFLLAMSVLLMTVYPVYIAPLFNKYTKLQDGPVFAAIEQLAKQVSFPLTQIFVVDGSKRSAHSNAYFYGFFKNKRIVLYDTLLEQVDIEEVKAILGHEMGHWALWHTVQGFLISQSYTLALFLAFSYVINTPSMYTSFGFTYAATGAGAAGELEMPMLIGLVLFTQTLWAPVDKVLTFLVNCNSRVNEFAADAFSVKLGYGGPLCSGLVKISVENLGCMVPDPLYSVYHYSHPPLVERLRAIEQSSGVSVKKGGKKDDKGSKESKDEATEAKAADSGVKERKKKKK